MSSQSHQLSPAQTRLANQVVELAERLNECLRIAHDLSTPELEKGRLIVSIRRQFENLKVITEEQPYIKALHVEAFESQLSALEREHKAAQLRRVWRDPQRNVKSVLLAGVLVRS